MSIDRGAIAVLNTINQAGGDLFATINQHSIGSRQPQQGGLASPE